MASEKCLVKCLLSGQFPEISIAQRILFCSKNQKQPFLEMPITHLVNRSAS